MGYLKEQIQKWRARRAEGDGSDKLSNSQKQALVHLIVTAFFCVIDGEISAKDKAELREAWEALKASGVKP